LVLLQESVHSVGFQNVLLLAHMGAEIGLTDGKFFFLRNKL